MILLNLYLAQNLAPQVQNISSFKHASHCKNARLQQYVNRELPDVQAGFRKGTGSRDQIANICWIIEKAREYQENVHFCFIDYAKPLTV